MPPSEATGSHSMVLVCLAHASIHECAGSSNAASPLSLQTDIQIQLISGIDVIPYKRQMHNTTKNYLKAIFYHTMYNWLVLQADKCKSHFNSAVIYAVRTLKLNFVNSNHFKSALGAVLL